MISHSLTFARSEGSVENRGRREVLKTEGEARGFQPSRGPLRMLMNGKIMFDRYYCINSTKHCKNEENIGALYVITSSHFPTRARHA